MDELAQIRFAAKRCLEKGYPTQAHIRPYGDGERFFKATTGMSCAPALVSDGEVFRREVLPILTPLIDGAYRVSVIRTIEPVLVTGNYEGLEPNMPALELLVVDNDDVQQWFTTDRTDLWFGPERGSSLPAAVLIIQEALR